MSIWNIGGLNVMKMIGENGGTMKMLDLSHQQNKSRKATSTSKKNIERNKILFVLLCGSSC